MPVFRATGPAPASARSRFSSRRACSVAAGGVLAVGWAVASEAVVRDGVGLGFTLLGGFGEELRDGLAVPLGFELCLVSVAVGEGGKVALDDSVSFGV